MYDTPLKHLLISAANNSEESWPFNPSEEDGKLTMRRMQSMEFEREPHQVGDRAPYTLFRDQQLLNTLETEINAGSVEWKSLALKSFKFNKNLSAPSEGALRANGLFAALANPNTPAGLTAVSFAGSTFDRNSSALLAELSSNPKLTELSLAMTQGIHAQDALALLRKGTIRKLDLTGTDLLVPPRFGKESHAEIELRRELQAEVDRLNQ